MFCSSSSFVNYGGRAIGQSNSVISGRVPGTSQQAVPVFSSPCTFLVGLPNSQPAVCMWPRIAKNTAQHQIINCRKYQGKMLLCVYVGLCLFNLDCVVSGMNFGDGNTVLQCQKAEHPQEGWYVWAIWIAPFWGISEISHLFRLSCNQTFSPEMISSLILPNTYPFTKGQSCLQCEVNLSEKPWTSDLY